jgi:hypothetical protein
MDLGDVEEYLAASSIESHGADHGALPPAWVVSTARRIWESFSSTEDRSGF